MVIEWGVVREHAGRLAVSLMHVTGDFGAAEDLVQDAVDTALERWPSEGVPERPDAWLFTVALAAAGAGPELDLARPIRAATGPQCRRGLLLAGSGR